MRVASLDDLEAQSLLRGRRSQGILIFPDTLTGSRRSTASGAGPEAQTAELLVELISIDALERVETDVVDDRARRGTAGACGASAGQAARVMVMGAILGGLEGSGEVAGLRMLF
jgi:hypothetical protein